MDINVDIENIVEYLTNSVNITSKFYDIFFNPIPMDVTFEQYNDNNELVEVTIPNRAKDLKNIETGDGSPEGQASGERGSLYIDVSTPQLYIKVNGDSDTGWVAIPNQNEIISIIQNYLEVNDYAKVEDIGDGTVTITQGGVFKGSLNVNQKGNTVIDVDSLEGEFGVDQTYNPNSTNAQSGVAVAEALESIPAESIVASLGYTPYDASNPDNYITDTPATSESLGVVKFDDLSITENENNQIQTSALIEKRAQVPLGFWVGSQLQYDSLEDKDIHTLYIIEDTEG